MAKQNAGDVNETKKEKKKNNFNSNLFGLDD